MPLASLDGVVTGLVSNGQTIPVSRSLYQAASGLWLSSWTTPSLSGDMDDIFGPFLLGWWSGANNGSGVPYSAGSLSTVKDLSTNGHDLGGGTGCTVVTNVLGGLPVFRFSSASSQFIKAVFTLNQPCTTLVVAKMLTIPSSGQTPTIVGGGVADMSIPGSNITTGVYALYAGLFVTAASAAWGTSVFHLVCSTVNSSHVGNLWADGSHVLNGVSVGSNNPGGITLAASNGGVRNYADCQIAEVVAVAREATQAQLDAATVVLNGRWSQSWVQP